MNCMRIVRVVALSIFSWLLTLILLPILVPLTTLLVAYKCFVNAVVRRLHPDWTPLSGLDIACIASGNNEAADGKVFTNIGLVLVVDGDLDLAELQNDFKERILDVKVGGAWNGEEFKFHRLMEHPLKFMGHLYFTPPTPPTNLSPIIKEVRLDGTYYQRYLIDWSEKHYTAGQPLWEVLLLKGEEKYKGKSLVGFKMSHGLGDMMSVKTILSHLLGEESTSAPQQGQGQPKELCFSSFFKMLKMIAQGPYLLLGILIKMSSHGNFMAENGKVEDCDGVEFKLEVETVKQIRRAYGCRFTDVLIALLASSLRRFLLESTKEENLPQTIPFYSSRDVPKRRQTMCNNLTQILVNVPMKQPSTEERLLDIRRQCEASLKSGTPELIHYFTFVPALMPLLFMGMQEQPSRGMLCAFSGIPLGEKKLLFGKHGVSRIFPISSMAMKQLAISSMSLTFGDELFFGIIGKKGVFQDPQAMERMKTHFLHEMDALAKTCVHVGV